MNLQTFTLTPPNAVALEQYAELAGVTPQEFLNAFLAEFLVERFGDPQVGDAEPFLLGFSFNNGKKPNGWPSGSGNVIPSLKSQYENRGRDLRSEPPTCSTAG